MSDIRHINEEYTEIGMWLINNTPELEYIKTSNASIVFLSSEAKKTSGGKTIYGQCEKVADKYRWGIPADFTITLFEKNIKGMDHEQIKILLFHELLHVGIKGDKYSVVPHDLEDFKIIIDKFGTNWSEVK